jgi:hypothetical protein
MGLFRKKETYNEQMLREAGLDRVVLNTPQPAPDSEATTPGEGTTDDSRSTREWDLVTTVLAQIHGHRVDFMTLPNGDLIVIVGNGDDDFAPLADAIEEHVSVPYTAIATRRDGNVWTVRAKRIDVDVFQFPDADVLELTQSDGVSEFDVDGEPSDATPPAVLQQLGERQAGDFRVKAERIDGDYWEVKVSSH